MGDYYCNACDKSIKLKTMKKHINTKSHADLSMSIINRYCVKHPQLFEIEEIIKRHVDDCNKKFEMYHIKCEKKRKFVDTIIHVKPREMYCMSSYWRKKQLLKVRRLRMYLVKKGIFW